MQGLESYTDSGILQVGVHPSIGVLQSWSIPNTGWTRRNISGAANPTYFRAFSANIPRAGCFLVVTGNAGSIGFWGDTTASTFSGSLFSPTPSALSGVQVHLVGPMTPSASGAGLQTWDENGRLLFDSAFKGVGVVGTLPLTSWENPLGPLYSNNTNPRRLACPLLSAVVGLMYNPQQPQAPLVMLAGFRLSGATQIRQERIPAGNMGTTALGFGSVGTIPVFAF